jgi:cytochrome c2
LAWIASAIVLSAGAASASASASTTAIQFRDHGKAVKSLSLEELKSAVPPQEVRVYEPHEKIEIEFRALPLAAVLDHVYGGPAWRKAGEVFFVCADGYKDPVSVERIAKHKAWLAFARKDKPSFTLHEKDIKQDKDLAHLFLVWDTLGDAESRALGGQGWPFQIVGIDLIEFADRFPGLVPPKGASASARRGFELFAKACVSCHALNGVGSKIGPELNSPVSVTTYFKEDWLKKWIASPSALRAGTSMPAPFPPGPGRAQQVDDVVAYLKAMAMTSAK